MPTIRRSLPLAAVLLAVAACTDAPAPAAPGEPTLSRAPDWQPPPDPDRARDQRLARGFALALNNPDFRAEVHAALRGSRLREGRVHLQQFLLRDGARALGRLAALVGEPAATIRADLEAAPGMEVYLPVPAHRERWRGDGNLLVATARADREVPVAFDLRGGRHLLDPRTPPETPVLALQTWEGKDEPGCADIETKECLGGGDGGGGDGTPGSDPYPPSSPPAAGALFMTAARFLDTFEGWLKGAPEFEIHMLGNKTGTTEMVTYQCVGEKAGGPYFWNQDDLDWSGSVMMFSQAQFDQFAALHPDQGLRLLILEDDDGPCQIKVNRDRVSDLFRRADLAYQAWTSGQRVKFSDFASTFTRAKSLYQVVSGLASFFKTNDDIVGTAILDPTAAGALLPGATWIVKDDRSAVTGALRLEMR